MHNPIKSDQDSLIRTGLARVLFETAAVALVLSLLASAAAATDLARVSSPAALSALASVVIASLSISTFAWWRLQRRIILPITALTDETARRQSADSDRWAGMAEIAGGVLHDVSNVLGSIQVSATLAQARMRQSKVSELVRTVELLEAHQDELAAYLAHDPKGRELPELLRLLATHLSDERADILRELEMLRRTVGHVKTIVSTQQSFTGASGTLEPVDIATR